MKLALWQTRGFPADPAANPAALDRAARAVYRIDRTRAADALIVGEISRSAQLEIAKIHPYRADRRPELYGALKGHQLA